MVATNTNSHVRVIIKENTNQTKIHEYTPYQAVLINNGRKKPDELTCKLSMSNRADISDTIHYVEDVIDLTYLDAIWDFQLSVRDERGYNYDISKRAENSVICNSVLAVDSVFVNGLQYVAQSGSKNGNNAKFDMSGTDATTAADLADSINNDTRIPTLNFDMVAVIDPNDDNKILIYLLPTGSAGNLATLTSNDAGRLTLGGALFSGGSDLDLPQTRFDSASDGKYQGNYMLGFQNTGEEVDIPMSGGVYQTGNGQGVFRKWNVDGQFDIDIWFTPENAPGQGNTNPVIFSFVDANNGLEISIEEDGSTGFWYIKLRYAQTGSFTTINGTSAVVFEETVTNDIPRHIRVMRGEDNIIRLFAMGEEDIVNTGVVTGTLDNPTTPIDHIRFGSDEAGTLDYDGYLNQVRLYSGRTLTESQYFKILGAKAIPVHMKFGGNIWDKKDKTTDKTILAQSYSKDLNNFKVTEDFITKLSLPTVGRGAVGGKDAFYTGNKSSELDLADPTMTDFALENHTSTQGLYIMSTTANQVTQWSMVSNTFDLKTAVEYSPAREFSVNTQDTQPSGIWVDAGDESNTNWAMVGVINKKIWHYVMSVGQDISSSAVQGGDEYDFSSETTSPTGVAVNSGHFYILDQGAIYKYTCSGFDFSTATFVDSLDVSGEDNGMQGIAVDINGEHIYLIGTENDKIYHYEMTTPHDISTAILSDSFDVSTEISQPKGIIYTGASDHLLCLDSGNKLAFKYTQRATHALAAANRYGAGEMDDIVADLINNLDDTFIMRTLATMPAQYTGSFLADGTFSEVVNLLLVRGNLTFYVNARKVLIIEKAVQSGNDQLTNHQMFQKDPNTNTDTLGGQSLGGVAGVFHNYKIYAVEQDDGKLINEITLLGARDQSGTVSITNDRDVQEGDTVHSLRINVPQLSNETDLEDTRDAILALTNFIKPQYKVEAPLPLNHLRFNHLVKIFNDMINIDGAIDGYLKIEAIESNYPSGKTVLTLNQFPITFFELSGAQTTEVNGLQSDTAIPVVFLSADIL